MLKRSARGAWASALCIASAMHGCASSSEYPPAAGYLGDARFSASERPPYSPSPAAPRSSSVDPRALVTQNPSDQARSLALAWTRALYDADERALEALSSDRVTDLDERALNSRAPWLEGCMQAARALTYAPPALPAEGLVPETPRVDRIERVRPQLPLGLLPGDLLVTLPWRAVGGGATRPPCTRALIVRPGPRPLVVGFSK